MTQGDSRILNFVNLIIHPNIQMAGIQWSF